MTVYISQQPVPNRFNWVPDLLPATEYGPLKFVFQGDENPYRQPQVALAKARKVLKEFDPDKDFILWPNTGDPAAMWAIILALSTRPDIDSINFLYWNKSKKPDGLVGAGYYSPIQFDLKENHGTQRHYRNGGKSRGSGSGNR